MEDHSYCLIQGISIHYRRQGKGFPLFFIHGLGGSLEHWSDSYHFFSEKGFEVIGIDLPGYGKSEKPQIEYTIPFYAQVVRDLILELKLKQAPILIGNSMGGHIASYFAAKYKSRLQGLVIVDGSGLNELNLVEEFMVNLAFDQNHIGNLLKYMVEIFAGQIFYDTKSPGAAAFIQEQKEMAAREDHPLYCHALEKSTKAMMQAPLKELLSEIRVPSCVIWGKNDRLIPSFYAEKFQKALPESPLFMMAKCGHVPQMEKPEEFNRILLEFLNSKNLVSAQEKQNWVYRFFPFLQKNHGE